MSAVIKFPKIIKLDPKRFHRQRLFYIGRVLEGPSYLSNYQEYYLRRNEEVRGNKRWSLKIFGFQKNLHLWPTLILLLNHFYFDLDLF